MEDPLISVDQRKIIIIILQKKRKGKKKKMYHLPQCPLGGFWRISIEIDIGKLVHSHVWIRLAWNEKFWVVLADFEFLFTKNVVFIRPFWTKWTINKRGSTDGISSGVHPNTNKSPAHYDTSPNKNETKAVNPTQQ